MAGVAALAGFVFIFVGLIGGGLEVKEVRIPQLPLIPRAGCFVVGCALIALALLKPDIFNAPTEVLSASTCGDKAIKDLGTDITTHVTTVDEVKRVLQHVGMYNGEIDNKPDCAYFKAVAEFQHSQGIDADGLVGPVTYKKLREAFPELFSRAKVN
jgi:hypothetical protein